MEKITTILVIINGILIFIAMLLCITSSILDIINSNKFYKELRKKLLEEREQKNEKI